MTFSHPIERLKMYDLDPSKWDFRHPPELLEVKDSTIAPYMPFLWQVEPVGEKPRVENPENGLPRFLFELTEEPNEFWQLFFENYRGGIEVAFEGKTLIITCEPKDLQRNVELICHSAVYKASNDYREERDKLLWAVFMKMQEQQRRDNTEADITREMENYRQQRSEQVTMANESGFSVRLVVQNFNRRYQEILENKFVWWSRVLEGPTIAKYRALFAAELLNG